ncbi:hypothetical protein uan_080 [Pseudomonas phage UAntarctica]|nr:hypothetical protein uan_080 [Pseudomonas phage UAntarctica]
MPVRVKITKLYTVAESGDKNAASVVLRQGEERHPVTGYMNSETGSYGLEVAMPLDDEVTLEAKPEGSPEVTFEWVQVRC